jgi:peptidoglycan-associated lipoprotein
MSENRKNALAVAVLVITAGLLAACGSPDEAGTDRWSETLRPPQAGNSGSGVGSTIQEDNLDALNRDWTDRVGDRVFFDVDKSVIRPDGRDQLAKWVLFLKQHPANRLLIEGHSDEHGTREYNLALGDRRAAAAREFLLINGIQAERITTVSYGKERPAVVGSNDTAWAQNRRAVGILQ